MALFHIGHAFRPDVAMDTGRAAAKAAKRIAVLLLAGMQALAMVQQASAEDDPDTPQIEYPDIRGKDYRIIEAALPTFRQHKTWQPDRIGISEFEDYIQVYFYREIEFKESEKVQDPNGPYIVYPNGPMAVEGWIVRLDKKTLKPISSGRVKF